MVGNNGSGETKRLGFIKGSPLLFVSTNCQNSAQSSRRNDCRATTRVRRLHTRPLSTNCRVLTLCSFYFERILRTARDKYVARLESATMELGKLQVRTTRSDPSEDRQDPDLRRREGSTKVPSTFETKRLLLLF